MLAAGFPVHLTTQHINCQTLVRYNTRMTHWRLLHTPPSTGAWNMAVDEAILEHIHRGESKPTLRLYAWNPPCLSLGHAQPFKDVDLERLRARGWDVVRRMTGGRAILHTDELTYSVSGPADDPVLAGGVLESYNRLAKALLFAMREIELPVEIKEESVGHAVNMTNNNPTSHASSAAYINPVCFEAPSTYEITVNGKKLIGSAQARKKEGVLQHGSLPLSGDLTRICDALVFEDEAARDAAKKRLLARATTVSTALGEVGESAFGVESGWERAARSFVQGFEAELGIRFEAGELSKSEIQRTGELVKEKYAHPSWNGRS
ncbi:MAG: Octanoyltransferase LipM [Anaerolineales bacterium]|nr:Octanoyltransferase LipM [Anaerolineales bacterium]